MILNIRLDDYHFTDLFFQVGHIKYNEFNREIFLFLKEEYEFYLDKIRILDTKENWYGKGDIILKHTFVRHNSKIENCGIVNTHILKSMIYFKKSQYDKTFDLEIDDDILTQFILEFR